MPVFESSRKVQSFGSSLALTLPVMFTKIHEIEKGSNLKLFFGLDGLIILSKHDDLDEVKRCMENILQALTEKEKRKHKK